MPSWLAALWNATVLTIVCSALTPVEVLAQSRVDRDGFTFDLPYGWRLLNNDGHGDFTNFNFHNVRGEVIQFSVSNVLSRSTYARTKKDLQARLKNDQSRDGWTLVKLESLNMLPHGELDEAVYIDRSYGLTSFSYNVYGPDRIALFTITFKGENPAAAFDARRLVKGLTWK